MAEQEKPGVELTRDEFADLLHGRTADELRLAFMAISMALALQREAAGEEVGVDLRPYLAAGHGFNLMMAELNKAQAAEVLAEPGGLPVGTRTEQPTRGNSTGGPH